MQRYTLTFWSYYSPAEAPAPRTTHYINATNNQEALAQAEHIPLVRDSDVVGTLVDANGVLITQRYVAIAKHTDTEGHETRTSWRFFATSNDAAQESVKLLSKGMPKTLYGPDGLIARRG